ncbi:MAG: hypothetical protein U0229_06200 [Anaeromyxobacter sp.]
MARDLAIRPLGLGQVVDRSVALTRRHFRALFLAMLVVEAPALALARLEASRLDDVLALVTAPARAAEALPALGAALAVLLVALLLLQLVGTAVTAVVVAPSLDPRPRPSARWGRLAAAVLSAAALHGALLVAAPAVAALPGVWLLARAGSTAGFVAAAVALVLLPLVAFVVALVRLVLAPAAAAVELRGPSALLRSSRLMAPPPGGPFLERPGVRASLVLLATFLLVLAVNAIAGLPRAIAVRAVGTPGPLGLPLGPLPLPLELALGLFEALAGAALQPFSLVAVVVLYFERRARTEGLDLERWAAGLGR